MHISITGQQPMMKMTGGGGKDACGEYIELLTLGGGGGGRRGCIEKHINKTLYQRPIIYKIGDCS